MNKYQMFDEEDPSLGLGDSFASCMNMNSNMIKKVFNPTEDCVATPDTIFSQNSYLTQDHEIPISSRSFAECQLMSTS